jgi:hypothetical protein
MRCATARHDPGGGGINVARVVRRLGGDVIAVYPCGGITGQLLAHLVEREHIASKTSELADETWQDFSVHEDILCCRTFWSRTLSASGRTGMEAHQSAWQEMSCQVGS